MNFIPTYLRILFCFASLLFCSVSAHANHLVGMDLFYTHISGNTYKITLIAYGDCGSGSTGAFSALPTNAPEIYIYNGNTRIATINLPIQPPSTGVEITPVCPADISNTQCTNISYVIPGIKKFVYSANYTLPTTSPVWRFLFTGQLSGSLAGRAVTITNISSSPVTYIQLVDTLNNTVSPNSNPILTNIPTPFFCLDNNDNYNPGAIDADGDSLRFFLVPGQSGSTTSVPGGLVTYLPGYSGTSPLAVTSMTFDQRTGQIAFYPNILQRSLVVYNIQEYRAGVFKGTSQREMTFLVQTCTNTPPTGGLSGATAGVIDDPTHFHICRNSGPFSMRIIPTQADTTNNITVTTTGLPVGCSFTTVANGTPHPICTISWTSTGVAPGVYTFFVTYTDDNCPLSGTQTIAYTITVLPEPTISYSIISAATCTKKAAVSIVPGGGGIPWTITISRPGDTIRRITGVTGAIIDSIPPGTFTLTVFSSAGYGCNAGASVTIVQPPQLSLTPTFSHPTFCGASDGTIKLYNLRPGTIDTIKFTRNGVLQPAQVHTVATDGTVTITGLLAGVYTGITETYGYCVSLPAGPITLINPPFTMRTTSFVNPVFCGVCNGSITLYGLHPGQIDTISYTLGGLFQPPAVRFIGSDSTATITGLCAGVYDNFVARTAGACVSNRLGPVTLTAPPFTMRTFTFTHPSYCGICDGTVRLYGLYPGGTDTISYTRFGLFQPPLSFVVGTDSIITITGLCAGAYDNFVARSGPSCISNSLGPANLVAPPFTMRAITFTNPDYCGICNGTIRLYGLHPGQLDTITYTLGGVPQPPVIRLIPADSTVTITGLCAGTYANFIARTAGVCVSNTLGPVTLTVPPFTMRSLSHTNPDYCGVCNGKITIYGLHPGNLDTISYTKDGIPQTPVIRLIPADSTVVITGLCAGVYNNFIARTGGVCVSNTLGPVALTVPPFTIRALGHTNPDYCGICNGSVTIYGLYPGLTDTISFTKDGVAQTPVVAVVPPDSMVTISGLCNGVYDNFIARTGGVCVSNALGPVSLVVPPFTIRTDTVTQPTKCGFCDGKITIFGVHPGQLDTFTYDFNGVPQPGVSFFIPADSIVTLTGLCEGLYTNIVARTAGVCVSNALGPHTLKAPALIPAFTYTITENCAGDTLICTNASWPPADLSYQWYFGDGGTSTAVHPMHVYYSPGTFGIKLVINNTKCYDSVTHTIQLDNLINAKFDAVPDSFVCQHDTVTFTNTSLGVQLKYRWFYGDGGTDTSLHTAHVYKKAGEYDVVLAVTNYVPCFDTAIKKLAVDSISAISIRATDSVICKATGITLTGTYSTLGLNSITWNFGNGDSTKNVNPISQVYDATGTFDLTLYADYRACPDTSATRKIRIFDHPNIYIGADTAICPGGNPIQLTDVQNADNPMARWKWNTGQTTPTIIVVEPGNYYAIVNINGCQSTDSIWVKNDCYMNIPNVFTPNGDGLNDYFFPRDMLTRGLSTFSMEIYNRWGQQIFSTTSTDGRGWDGRFNDVPQPTGVFIYLIDATFKDGQKEQHKGNVTLLR